MGLKANRVVPLLCLPPLLVWVISGMTEGLPSPTVTPTFSPPLQIAADNSLEEKLTVLEVSPLGCVLCDVFCRGRGGGVSRAIVMCGLCGLTCWQSSADDLSLEDIGNVPVGLLVRVLYLRNRETVGRVGNDARGGGAGDVRDFTEYCFADV